MLADKTKNFMGIGVFLFCCLLFLALALGGIQYFRGEAYTAMAQNQRLRTVDVNQFGRGQILDRNFSPLTNEAENCLVVFPSVFGDDQARLALLRRKALEINLLLEDTPVEGGKGVVLARGLNENQSQFLTKSITDNHLQGAYILSLNPRYSADSLASLLVGFVGEDTESTDLIGKAGLEKQYDSFLRNYGTDKIGVVVDEKGRKTSEQLRLLPNSQSTSPRADSGNLVLTINKYYQQVAEEALGDKSGAAVMLDIKNGDVLAMASTPNYNQNKGQPLVEGDVYINKAVAYYPPASVFKLVLVLAALDNDIPYDNNFFCDGGVTLKNGHRVSCWYQKGHGYEDITLALGNSCNPYFIKLGREIGGKMIKEYTYKLGLTQQNLIGYKVNTMPENPNFNSGVEGDVANVSIGEKGIRLTPLLVAQLLATIANDGQLVTPRLVMGLQDFDGNWVQTYGSSVPRQVVKAESAKALQNMLAQAVLAGTGTPVANMVISAGGKSGTTQNQGVWFAGFAPVEDPKWAIAVYLPDGSSGGKDGGAIFREIIEKAAIDQGLTN